ncbi:hypothetical protein DPMN_101219 [Dreissena polymorpha]|uniref:Uncharacterized protein n=1 Tax=Dreissena polymorpha TaxID=45954 RepID=A0A9D4LII4_DREPO|nr:hypothetical protein DPMN_101219 [Dreissena polymorpha]
MNMSNAKHLSLHDPDTLSSGNDEERRLDCSLFLFENLEVLELCCVCNIEDMTSCHNSERVLLTEGITNQSTSFYGPKLVSFKMKNCMCNGLDLSSCPNLETITIHMSSDDYGDITLIHIALHGLAKLKSLKMKECDFEEILSQSGKNHYSWMGHT